MRRVTFPLALALAWALCGLAPHARAQIYRWEDGQGRLHFSNDPPPPGAKSLGTLDTSQAKKQDPPPEPAPAEQAAVPAEGTTGPDPADELETHTFPLNGSRFQASVAIPSSCRSLGATPSQGVIGLFDCGRPGTPRDGYIIIQWYHQDRLTRDEVEAACRPHSESLPRIGSTMLRGDAIAVHEASCDPERHEFAITGTYRANTDLPEIQLGIVPTTDGLLGVSARWRSTNPPKWRSNSPPAMIRALRAASLSPSVPSEYLVWPSAGRGPATERASAHSTASISQAAQQRQQVGHFVGILFFLLGAMGAITLYRIVHSEELGARVRGPR